MFEGQANMNFILSNHYHKDEDFSVRQNFYKDAVGRAMTEFGIKFIDVISNNKRLEKYYYYFCKKGFR